MEKSTIRVLIVDDYEPWIRFIRSSVQQWPELQVVGEASDGREAVRKAAQLQPDLILLDIGLPTISGIEAAKQIRKLSPNARILFSSENVAPDVAEEALRVGAGGYLVKSDAGSELLSAVTSVMQGKRFVSRTLKDQVAMEPSDHGLICGHGHVVQFYEDDTVLLDELATLFRRSLDEGQSVAAVMTDAHRYGLERRLLGQGINVNEAKEDGTLCMLDADHALSEFMEPSGPSRERFLLQFGNILRTLQAAAMAKRGGVVVFGEMVALLWAQKRYDAAIRLEELWNELALTCSFHLCCAYPASAFRERLTGGPYAKICAQHSHVVSEFEAFPVPSS